MKPHETGTDNPIDFPTAEDELADNLDISDALNIADHLSQGYLEWCPEAEWVLRAQHVRIEELEAMLRQFGLAESIIKQQQLEIEALKERLANYEGWVDA